MRAVQAEAPRERPILMSGPMVRAILDGRKTQARRVIRPTARGATGVCIYTVEDVVDEVLNAYEHEPMDAPPITCPYGQPGDRLWVRETWQQFFEDELPEERRSGPRGTMGIPAQPDRLPVVAYRADGEIDPHPEHGPARWIPSIHMPRWASRITLEVTEVRVERLQDISASDACAEGAADLLRVGHPLRERVYEERGTWTGKEKLDRDGPYAGSIDAFATLWDSLAKPGARWDDNPWVWAVSFRRLP